MGLTKTWLPYPDNGNLHKYLAFLFGFAIILAHVPGWSQPAQEPKSALLLLGGALSWGWMAWAGRTPNRLPWAFVLPFAWLLATALWSPAPFLGMQRVIWFLASWGIASVLGMDDSIEALMKGILLGTAVHAGVIFVQWIPPIRALLPISLGVDPFQGIGRGLFQNTNMAAPPLLLLAVWLLWNRNTKSRWGEIHLLWVLPALALTHARFAMGICSICIAFVSTQDFRSIDSVRSTRLFGAMGVLLAVIWAGTAYRWAWILPLMAALFAVVRPGLMTRPDRVASPWWLGRSLAAVGLGLAIVFLLPVLPTHSRKDDNVGTDSSLAARQSFAKASFVAALDRPLLGHGLGSSRALYPLYVDRQQPSTKTAYGDFVRPNNYHSEPLELIVEGGLLLFALIGLGLWADARNRVQARLSYRPWLLFPLILLCGMDFPLHLPLGAFWASLALVAPHASLEKSSYRFDRMTTAILGCLLLILFLAQLRVAQQRPQIEVEFYSGQDAGSNLANARKAWTLFKFDADLFDLYSKAAIQAAASLPAGTPPELEALLIMDPHDHHLLLACAQRATQSGDSVSAHRYLERYAEVAPRDPDRYLRLAEDAIRSGKPDSALLLLQEARRQPGYTPTHETKAKVLQKVINR